MENTFFSSFPDVIKWIESNPLIVTLTSGGAVVWLFANLRSIFATVVDAVKACISFTVTNTYEDARGYGCGYALKLKQQVFNNILSGTRALWERTVNIDLSNAVSQKSSDTECSEVYETTYNTPDSVRGNIGVAIKSTNTYGFSIRVIFGKLCTVDRSYKLDGQRITMNTSIRVFFARKKKFIQMLEDKINLEVADVLKSTGMGDYVQVLNNATFSGLKMKRKLSSIFTKDNSHIKLFNSIKQFIENKETYKKLNYPYNYCALLYGVPGSGKTSTILAIASELKRNVYYINLSQMTTSELFRAFNDDPRNTIFVFEDIDALSYSATNTRSNTSSSKDKDADDEECSGKQMLGISLSDILNLTDGLLASDGTICLFTTNHIEKLDPAFLRAGRMNKTVEFTYMAPEVAQKMAETYLGTSFSSMKDNIKPAELQESILGVLLGDQTVDDLKSKFCIEQS